MLRKISAPAMFGAALSLIVYAGMSHRAVSQAADSRGVQIAAGRTEAIAENNLGVAYMDRQQPKDALAKFEKACDLAPNLTVARVNKAIALLNLQQYPQSRQILQGVTARDPENLRAWYNLGLLEKSVGNTTASIADFERAAAIDANDADTFYFLGQSYSALQQYPKAISALEQALKINHFHASAEFALAQALQRSGNVAGAREQLVRFQHLVQTKLGTPMSLSYGDQGKYSLAEMIPAGEQPVEAPIPVHFVNITRESGLPFQWKAGTEKAAHKAPAIQYGAGACILDFDGDGRPDIFLVNADGSGQPGLYRNFGGGKFEDVTAQSGIRVPGVGIACAAGDYDNDGRTDLAISGSEGVRLFHNEGNGNFHDVTEAAGIRSSGQALGLTFVDYDHDGDLDLFVARAPEAGSQKSSTGEANRVDQLWRNNGNGTFTEVAEQEGLTGSGPSWGAAASDINNDRAVDFVITPFHSAPEIYMNPREGQFHLLDAWSAATPSPAVGALAFDFDKDGWMDLAFTHSEAPGLSLWRNIDGKSFEQVKLPKLDWMRGWGLAALDYDDDGWIDLAATGEDASGGHVILLRNEGAEGFRDVTREVGLDKIHLIRPRSIVASDFFGNGATDLLITQAGGPPVLLRNVGGNRHHWIRVQLKGLNDNKSAIGTKVDVFAGTLQQKFEISGASGYMGQSDTSVDVGLDGATKVDILRLLWPTGVLQDEINLPADSQPQITELDRRGSSCPILFAWNGRKFQFIADILGQGIVGHWMAPGERNVPNPSEYLKVDGADVRAKNGLLRFRLLEPEEELDYLDRVRLIAVDHPAGVSVYSNGHFSMQPPFPAFRITEVEKLHPPAGAWDDRGRNVLPLLLAKDHKFVKGFDGPAYAGFARPHWLELDLGNWNARKPLKLVLDGFTDYFSASSLYAAWQAGLKPIPPYVEALGKNRKWQQVIANMGFPAGLERTMTVDLTGKVPPGTRRIRIVTNLKIYWDRIRVSNSDASSPIRTTEVPLSRARLAFRGFPLYRESATPGDLSYDYEKVSATGPYARQAGNYTRYGDVRPLLEKVDEKYVVFGAGDEVAVDFDPSALPPLPKGWKRDYFFYANGFDKDMDFYAADGSTVSPYPVHTLIPYPYPSGTEYPLDLAHLDYLLRYNTRAVSGAPPKSYRFVYRKEGP